MADFFMVSTRRTKNGLTEIYPKFVARSPSEHLMIRGGDFYAVWVEKKDLWSTKEQDAFDIIDDELYSWAEQNKDKIDGGYRVLPMWDVENGMIDRWHKFCKQQMRDCFHQLDEKLIFSNTKTTRLDYASKRLSYPLEEGDISAWTRLLEVLYPESERHKIEWAIGSVVSGESKALQKFMVFYGSAGTGKSTVLNIIQELFDGYTCVFDAKALGSANSSFALEPFRSNPLVAVQHDGDLSRIEDNTRINSIVSHEVMTVNEKFKTAYEARFKCFLFIGTNKPVRITDAKSGLIRRLIDVSPSGDKLGIVEYRQLTQKVKFELGAIAKHCLDWYMTHKDAYDNYVPITMLGASNDFYNFVLDAWPTFSRDDSTTLKAAWMMYKDYCEEAKVMYPYPQRAFKEELKNYFKEFRERDTFDDGTRVRNCYIGFKQDKFKQEDQPPKTDDVRFILPLGLKVQPSLFDILCSDCPAQYANDSGTPLKRWADVTTKLADLDTRVIHYVKVPENHIVVDFDIPDENGEKSLDRNIEEAEKWPPTYAEVSKGGQGIHLHYIYDGDVSQLSSVYGDHIEIKKFTGNSSLRRRLSLCNDIPIAKLTHGLPLKEPKKVDGSNEIHSEKALRELIKRNLAKEIHPATKPSIDFIFALLEEAYKSDLTYDVSDMHNAILGFAAGSTHNAAYCVKLVQKMHFKSREKDIPIEAPSSKPNVFYDIEVYPNLFLVCWKYAEDYSHADFERWADYILELQTNHKPVVCMINPSSAKIEEFVHLHRNNMIDFNGRRYDRHILYGRVMNYDNEQIYNLSQRIIGNDRNTMFSEAYKWGKTDVYDFASAANKKSLKKLEIDMGFTHKESDIPWDQPVPDDKVEFVTEYCKNDVLATEAAFNYLAPDWNARCILADLAGMSVNDTTNALTARIIFGKDANSNPQHVFKYRNLAEPVQEIDADISNYLEEAMPDMYNWWRYGNFMNVADFIKNGVDDI